MDKVPNLYVTRLFDANRPVNGQVADLNFANRSITDLGVANP